MLFLSKDLDVFENLNAAIRSKATKETALEGRRKGYTKKHIYHSSQWAFIKHQEESWDSNRKL
jgi:hypothetical protein